MAGRIAVAALALAAFAASASPAQADSACGSQLPTAPVGLPASVVVKTACGAYALDPAGRLSSTDRPRSPWAYSPSRFTIDIRRNHVVLFVGGKLRWRSRHVFYKEIADLGSVALGRRNVAFSFTNGKLWVAPLNGVEHAVAWNEWALVWTRHEELLAGRVHRDRTDLFVRRADGSDPRLIATKRAIVYPEDQTVLYVSSAGNLVRTDGRRQTVLASLSALGLARNPELQLDPRGLIIVSSTHRLAVLRHDGSMFATTRFPEVPGLLDRVEQVAAARDRVAFALNLWEEDGTLKQESVFVLREGATAATHVLDVPADYFGCGWTDYLSWHGSWLLYWDVLDRVVALDTDGPGRVDLSSTVEALPGAFDFAVWA